MRGESECLKGAPWGGGITWQVSTVTPGMGTVPGTLHWCPVNCYPQNLCHPQPCHQFALLPRANQVIPGVPLFLLPTEFLTANSSSKAQKSNTRGAKANDQNNPPWFLCKRIISCHWGLLSVSESFFFFLWRAWNLFLRAAKSGLVLWSDLRATCVHFTETGQGPWHRQATRAAKSQGPFFWAKSIVHAAIEKMKAFTVARRPASLWGLWEQLCDRRTAGDKGLSLWSAHQAGVGSWRASFPGTMRNRYHPICLLSLSREGRQADRQRDLFQLPLTLFIITNMKGRERDGVYRTGSLCNLIYLSPAAVGWAVSSFVSDAGNWNMNLCWWENKGTERGINLIFLQPSKISFLWRRGLYFCN